MAWRTGAARVRAPGAETFRIDMEARVVIKAEADIASAAMRCVDRAQSRSDLVAAEIGDRFEVQYPERPMRTCRPTARTRVERRIPIA